MSYVDDMRQARDKEIAGITAVTAMKVNEHSAEASRLIAERKTIPWYRFRRRRRLKRAIRQAVAFSGMIAIVGATQIATVMSKPIPKYPPGEVPGKSGIAGPQ